jgi:methylenetetrahydrofolate--tRNA-(uracil-5-)-methyltransferase
MTPRPDPPASQSVVTVIGGGLAGSEAAWAAARRGVRAKLHEMRPVRMTPAHRTDRFAELVCSNSLKSARLTNAAGLLKEEMRRLGSLIVPCAERSSVPAGEALAVDPQVFADEVTRHIEAQPWIAVVRDEVTAIPDDRPLIIATGPLTSESLAARLADLTGERALHFYDAVAPTVTLESLGMDQVFRASRRGRGTSPDADDTQAAGDYLNCPMNREEYEAFYDALIHAEVAQPHLADERDAAYFEACMPVEVLAARGPRTLAFGPMRPVGLTDPRTGRRPYAVVQLRQENRQGTLWGLVGFQTRLKWSEQRRVFRMIPGLQNAEFVRYGVMHRNTYVNSPTVLQPGLAMARHPDVFLAGQLTGVEGYVESAAMGIVAGINAVRLVHGHEPVVPPPETVLGSLCRYITEADAGAFAPMNANHGLLPPLEQRPKNRAERGMAYAERSLAALEAWMRTYDLLPEDGA